MTYRSDHDAALARAHALEVELARERAERRRLEAVLARRDPAPPREALVAANEGTEADRDVDGDEPSAAGIYIVCMAAMVGGMLLLVLPFYLLTVWVTGRW